jgi:hypothetical protein
LQSGAVAGWDKGFFIGSVDGNFLLRIASQMQIRAVYNWQDSDGSADTNRFGFEVRRIKIDFKGHVFDPSWQYHVEMQTNRNGGSFALGENGWIQKDLGNGWAILAGQYKPMFLREESISSRRLHGIERSLINDQFTVGAGQGVQAAYKADQFRVLGSFYDGIETANTGWQNEDTEYAFTARGEFLAMGDWKGIEDDSGWKGGDNVLMFGAAVAYQNDEYGTTSDGEVSNLGLTADVTWKSSGWSVAAGLMYRHLESDTGSPADLDLDQLGFVLRGGFFIQEDLELYAMYEWGDLDIDDVEELSVITFGVTKYWDKHNLKWQNDIGFGLDEVASEWASEGAGWRADPAGEDGQVVFRSQFQLLF